MATFNKFEDILARQKARMLRKIINSYTQNELFSRDFKLISQIKSSSGSAMDNIAEGLREEETKNLFSSSLFPKLRQEKPVLNFTGLLTTNIFQRKSFKKHTNLPKKLAS